MKQSFFVRRCVQVLAAVGVVFALLLAGGAPVDFTTGSVKPHTTSVGGN